MGLVITVRYDANTRERAPSGDLTTTIYDIVATGALPADGEPISFAAQFKEVHAVLPTPAWLPTGVGMVTGGSLLLGWERDTVNTGRIRAWGDSGIGAGSRFQDAVGAWPLGGMSFTLVVTGRPATDAS